MAVTSFQQALDNAKQARDLAAEALAYVESRPTDIPALANTSVIKELHSIAAHTLKAILLELSQSPDMLRAGDGDPKC
jgi:hypothetical protein